MATKTGINTVPTKPQADLLLAALGTESHRIPSTATGRTLDIMLRRQWVKEYTANGRLASTVRDYSGFTHFRLTHHGVNAAKKARVARTAAAERGPRTLNAEGIGWTCVKAGRKWTTEHEGVKFELERRTRNVADECPDTGWYLFGGSHFGEYMGARFKAAAVEAFPYVCPKDGHPQSAPAQLDRWSVQDREGNEVAEVEATGYDHAVQVAAQDPKVRAAEPGSGGLVYRRRGAVQKSAPVAVEGRSVSTYGALGATLKVPQVYAAIRVLKAGQQVLGGFADTGHCVNAGAYLDARQDTGEVILSCEGTHVRPAGSVLRELLDERERAVVGYAGLFRTAGWYVQEVRENGQDGRRRLARLVMELPTTLPWMSRVRRASDGRFGTITDYSGNDRMVIKWDRAVFPDPFHRTTAELMGPAYQVFPAVDHCSGCGEIVRDDDVEDSYTTCCNEGACSGCAAVNGVYACGTEAPTGTTE